MNDNTSKPSASSSYSFLKPNSPPPQSVPGLNFFLRNTAAVQPQPSLGLQMSRMAQNTLPGKVLGLVSMATENAQQMVQAPLEAGLGKVVQPAAAKVAASNAVSFLTPPSLSIAQGMNHMLRTWSTQGLGDTSLTAVKAGVSKLGTIPALLVNQFSRIQLVGQTFWGASQAQKQQQQPPKKGMGV